MGLVKSLALFVLVIALSGFGPTTAGAAQAKHSSNQRGSHAPTHKDSRGAVQGNQQWSADPERGWVRRENESALREQRSAGKQHDQGRGRSNGKGKKS
jgi:hypothetical protein